MLARLGRHLYWLGSGLAAVALVSGVFILQHGLDQDYGCLCRARWKRCRVLAARMGLQIFSGWRMSQLKFLFPP
jgi:hypothetical protein